MWSFKKKMDFAMAAKFNYELDSNEELRVGLQQLALRRKELGKDQYLTEMLELFRREGLELSMKELDMLLLLRQKTDQILREDQKERSEI